MLVCENLKSMKKMNVKLILIVICALAVIGALVIVNQQAKLHDAVREGNIEKIKEILTSDVPINQLNQGETALEIAAAKGNIEIVALLLAKGADPNVPGDSTKTPLFFIFCFQ